MKATIFTPMHRFDKKVLMELFDSLDEQTEQDFEWLILLNGKAQRSLIEIKNLFKDCEWVRVETTRTTANIGALKAECCELAKGEILIEVDYDDQLTTDAVERITDRFKASHIQFVYSDCWEYKEDGSTNDLYGTVYGWQHYQWGNEGKMINNSFPALPQYLRRIEWSPNHVRAFRKSAYEKIGGYNKEIKVGDDHDLICRFYLEYGWNGFDHIKNVLYLYRIHQGNTSNGNNQNAQVQKQIDINYCNHAEGMFKKWALDEGLLCLDLGGRFNCPEGYESVDLLDADYIVDLTKEWPFEESSVGVLRAYHILEHLPDTIHFFNEAFRVLAPGGLLLIEVPSSNGKGAFSDPTHIRFFNDLSFEYFTNQNYAKYIQPQFKGKFQKSRVVEYWWDNPNIPIVSAQLLCLKGWYEERWCGFKEM